MSNETHPRASFSHRLWQSDNFNRFRGKEKFDTSYKQLQENVVHETLPRANKILILVVPRSIISIDFKVRQIRCTNYQQVYYKDCQMGGFRVPISDTRLVYNKKSIRFRRQIVFDISYKQLIQKGK